METIKEFKGQCLTDKVHKMRLMTEPAYKKARKDLKKYVRSFTEMSINDGLPSWHIRIPVVVHIVKGPKDPYISDERIKGQIQALNEDFSMSNAEIGFTHYQKNNFGCDAVSTGIQFALAVRDPLGRPTNGITRRRTSMPQFNAVSRHPQDNLDMTGAELVKFPKYGQVAWPADSYLNVWVCNFTVDGDSYCGYAAYPGAPENLDGVVINSGAFGRYLDVQADVPHAFNLSSKFNRGRSLTHEVGHWLNLYHVSGCDNTPDCTDSDQVPDTPNQLSQNLYCPYLYPSSLGTGDYDPDYDIAICAQSNFSTRDFDCQALPHVSCNSTNSTVENPLDPRGDMFMNIMDYTQDMCRFMFTAGQVKRMEATLNGYRRSLFASDGLIPPSGTKHPGLWISDSPWDTGLDTDNTSPVLFASNDIWLNSGRPIPIVENDKPRPGKECNIFVRVRNGSSKETKARQLKLYWAKSSTALGWPYPWNETADGPDACGGLVGVKDIGAIKPGGYRLLSFGWAPPRAHVNAPGDSGNFAFLARIVDDGAPNDGMIFAEGPNLIDNVRNNSKIAMNNVCTVKMLNGDSCTSNFEIGSTKKYQDSGSPKSQTRFKEDKRTPVRLYFGAPVYSAVKGKNCYPGSILDWGTVRLDLGPELFKEWTASGRAGEGVEPYGDNKVMINVPGAWIAVSIKPKELYTLGLEFKRQQSSPGLSHVFHLDISQHEPFGDVYRLIGGLRFIVKTFSEGKKIT